MRRLAVIAGLGLLVASCGGATLTTTTSTGVATSDRAEVATTTGGAPATTSNAESGSVRDLGIDTITLQSSDEGGPHPTLRWEPVDGAETYWLTLRDGTGGVYWAWSGPDTSVRVGGGTSPELNQTAALHEPMSWSVIAIDESGTLIALSSRGTVSP